MKSPVLLATCVRLWDSLERGAGHVLLGMQDTDHTYPSLRACIGQLPICPEEREVEAGAV